MKVVWDPEKARTNFKKHGIHFSDAEVALFDPMALTREDEAAQGEQRFITIGTDAVGKIVVVVYTYRGDGIRLITARRATASERKGYEK